MATQQVISEWYDEIERRLKEKGIYPPSLLDIRREYIKLLKERKGGTVKQLSEMSGIPTRTIYRDKNGK